MDNMEKIARQLDDLNDLLWVAVPTLIGAVAFGGNGVILGLLVGAGVTVIRNASLEFRTALDKREEQ